MRGRTPTRPFTSQLQPLRGNVFAVIDALRASDVFFSLNHLFHFYRDQVPLETYLRLLALVPAVEARNGTMLREHNELIARLARGWPHQGARGVHPPVALLGGSDAHTLRRVGQTWTQSPGTTATEFLRGLREGLAEPGGNHGTAATVAGDTYGVVARFAAGLLGYGPRDHRGWARAARLAFVAVSAPAQFLPMLIALQSKRREGLMIARAIDTLTGQTPVPAAVASPMTGAR